MSAIKAAQITPLSFHSQSHLILPNNYMYLEHDLTTIILYVHQRDHGTTCIHINMVSVLDGFTWMM